MNFKKISDEKIMFWPIVKKSLLFTNNEKTERNDEKELVLMRKINDF